MDEQIVLTVAAGKAVVPELVGLPLAQAGTLAGRYGFELDTPREEETDAHAPGTVFDQDPVPNEVKDRSTKIKITIAKAVTLPPDQGDPDPDDPGDGDQGDGENP